MDTKPQQRAPFYDSHYAHHASPIYAEVRREVFGTDIGQNSWLTVNEVHRFIEWLVLTDSACLLDVGSGSGGPALFIAEITGCQVTGVDTSPDGVQNANRLALARGLQGRARFQVVDGSLDLPFDAATFTAITCIDTINHLPNRSRVLAEWRRMLRPGDRLLFTDPLTVTGILSNAEIAIRTGSGTRASHGYSLFTPEGVDEQLIAAAGFILERREDVTENMVQVAGRWRDARERRRSTLIELEGEDAFAGQQQKLEVAHRIAAERRLSRFAFVARKS